MQILTIFFQEDIVHIVDPKSTKLVYFIRHAEAAHNKAAREAGSKMARLVYQDPKYEDARLTEKGLEQAQQIKSQMDIKVGELSIWKLI